MSSLSEEQIRLLLDTEDEKAEDTAGTASSEELKPIHIIPESAGSGPAALPAGKGSLKWIRTLAAAAACLILAILSSVSFVKFTLFASAIQVVTGLGIILAYHLSRKRVGKAEIVGRFGTLPFQIFVFLCTLLATAGSFMG